MSVYAISDGTHVKIGTSRNVASRIKSMQTANVNRLDLLWAEYGGPDFEAYVHEQLAEFHVRGEWFDLFAMRGRWQEGGADPDNAVRDIMVCLGDRWAAL